MSEDFNEVWQRIIAHAGEQFQTNNGTVFRYEVSGDAIRPVNTELTVTRSDLERYYRLGADADTGKITTLTGGASFVWGILGDRRIRGIRLRD